MRKTSANHECKNLDEFMEKVGAITVNDIGDKRIDLKVYIKYNGYVLLHDLSKARNLAEQYDLKIGTISVCDKGREIEGDSDSRFISLWIFRTRDHQINVKKYFLYTRNVDATYSEIY